MGMNMIIKTIKIALGWFFKVDGMVIIKDCDYYRSLK